MCTQTPLQSAIEIMGSQTALARACGVEQGHVWHWLNRAKKLPAERAIQIEHATNGRVTRHQLRPDLFGPPQTDSQTNAA